ADQIRDDAVESDARQQERHCGEGVEQDHREALRSQRACDHLIHRLRSGDDVLAVLALRHAAQRSPERWGRSLGAYHYAQTGRAARRLPERFVELSLERLLAIRRINTPLLHVSDYPDNLQWVSVITQVDTLADGVGVWEILAGEDLVNHHDCLSSLIILVGEKAASLEWDAHGRQIGGFDPIDERHVHLARARWLRLTLEPEPEIV